MGNEIQIQEIHDRVRRMETLLFKIAEASGITKEKERVTEVLDNGDVRLIGYDVTLSRIRKDLKEANKFEPGTVVGLWIRKEYVGEVMFYNS
jgi:hypothetical protein